MTPDMWTGQVDTEVIVIGAGPAGLAVGACLCKANVDFLILEREDRVCSRWRQHYDRLNLHTDKRRSQLPFRDYPDHYPRYPTRQQVIDYLEEYAAHFQLEPRFNQCVVRAYRHAEEWHIETQDTRYRSRFLVVATGYSCEPSIPDFPDREGFRGPVLHSSRYRDGAPFTGQDVLVVGLGNSGGEIAIDLYEHGARPAIAVRGPVNLIPREVLGLPILAMAIPLSKLPSRLADLMSAPAIWWEFGDIRRLGLNRLPVGPMTQIERFGRIPLIDVGTVDLIKQCNVAVRPGITRFTETGVEFVDGSKESYDAVVLATGYHPRVDRFLEGAESVLGDGGRPATSGRETDLPGLYFCGFFVAATGMLREISIESRRIAADIKQKIPARAPTSALRP